MQTPRKFISRFSPNRTDPEVLERIDVQREDLLSRSIAVLRESALTENKHHLLFVGPRGSGKTHLLALIFHRLQGQADLAEHLRIAWLNEDETSTSFLDLLLRMYRALADRHPAEFPGEVIEQLKGRDSVEALDILSKTLISQIGQRTVLVLIENLDTLFSQLDEGEQRAWRAFIQNHSVFATAATAQSLFAGVAERDQPFFGFFDTTHLQPFTAGEAVELLRRIAQLNHNGPLMDFLGTPQGKARVQAVHHLSGGNPRLYIVLSDFITCESLDELVGPFEEMVDEQLTPYYQERLRWLSPQQRKIVEFLCLRARPAPVKEISAALFAEPGSIGSQLQKLREMGYVRPNPRGRESLYELAEPLMRLSMEVKNTHNQQPLRVIVDFLRVWFEHHELERLSTRCDTAGLGFKYLTAALEKLKPGQPDFLREMLLQDIEGIDLKNCDPVQLDNLRLLAEESCNPDDLMKYARACFHHEDFPAALEWLGKIVELPGAAPDQVAWALVIRGAFFELQWRVEEAIADFTRAIELRGVSPEPLAAALVSRGVSFDRHGRTEEAIADFTRAIDLPGAPDDVVLVGKGWMARLLFATGEWNSGMEYLTQFLAGQEKSAPLNTVVSTGLVQAIFGQIGLPDVWQARAAQALALCREHKTLVYLGGALVQHLAVLKECHLNPAGFDQWLAGWEAHASGETALQLPLRLLRAGIAYLKTQPRDAGALLQLPSEERNLVGMALGLAPERSD